MCVHRIKMVFYFLAFILEIYLVAGENITIGYITGSQKPDDDFYRRPGQAISGALTLALDEINNDTSILPNHRLTFLIAETRGKEFISIKETVELINKNISVYIGPQETCIHEAKIAAAFNIPMISYVSGTFNYLSLPMECYYDRYSYINNKMIL